MFHRIPPQFASRHVRHTPRPELTAHPHVHTVFSTMVKDWMSADLERLVHRPLTQYRPSDHRRHDPTVSRSHINKNVHDFQHHCYWSVQIDLFSRANNSLLSHTSKFVIKKIYRTLRMFRSKFIDSRGWPYTGILLKMEVREILL